MYILQYMYIYRQKSCIKYTQQYIYILCRTFDPDFTYSVRVEDVLTAMLGMNLPSTSWRLCATYGEALSVLGGVDERRLLRVVETVDAGAVL